MSWYQALGKSFFHFASQQNCNETLLNCSQSPIFPRARKCQSVRFTGHPLGLLMRARLGGLQNARGYRPSFARSKRPRWRPVELNHRRLRSHGKMGDCEQTKMCLLYCFSLSGQGWVIGVRDKSSVIVTLIPAAIKDFFLIISFAPFPYCVIVAKHCNVRVSPSVALVLVSPPYIILHTSLVQVDLKIRDVSSVHMVIKTHASYSWKRSTDQTGGLTRFSRPRCFCVYEVA